MDDKHKSEFEFGDSVEGVYDEFNNESSRLMPDRVVSNIKKIIQCGLFAAICGGANFQWPREHSSDYSLYSENDPVWPDLSAKLNEMSSKELANLIEEVFEIKVIMNEESGFTDLEYEVHDDEDVLKDRLVRQIGALLKYSPNMLEKLKGTKLYNYKSCSRYGFELGGMANSIKAAICTYEIKTFFHEIFHVLDAKDGFISDNFAWTAININGDDYYLSRSLRGLILENPSIEGTVSAYARTNANEDQAEIGSHLFVPEMADLALVRQKTDSVLREKIERLTGTSIDNSHVRTKFNTWNDNYCPYEYFPSWGREGVEVNFPFIVGVVPNLADCKTEAGHAYWNTITSGFMPLFGRTKEEQIKWVLGR